VAGRMVKEQGAYMLSELFSVNAYKIIPDCNLKLIVF
jgi:hypothetical protein